MRRLFGLFLSMVMAFALIACSSCPNEVAPLQKVPVAAAPAPAASPCASSFAAPAPAASYAYAVGEPVGVEFRTGAEEHARAAIAVPPEVAACLVAAGSRILLDGIQGVQCALNALIPKVTPSQRYVYAQPAAAPAPAAAPCIPAPATPPPGQWQWIPAPPTRPAAAPASPCGK